MGLFSDPEGVERKSSGSFSPAWAVTRFKATCSAGLAIAGISTAFAELVDKAGAIS